MEAVKVIIEKEARIMLILISAYHTDYVYLGGSYLEVVKGYSWLCAHGPLLAMLKGLYMVKGLEMELAACQTSA